MSGDQKVALAAMALFGTLLLAVIFTNCSTAERMCLSKGHPPEVCVEFTD